MVKVISTSTNVAAAKRESEQVNWTNNPEGIAALKTWASLKATEKAGEQAKKERTALEEQVIRPMLGTAHEVKVRGVIALKESSERTNNSVDQKLLLEAFPEAYAATLRTTTYTFFTVNVPAE
jgi:hypothetical protein